MRASLREKTISFKSLARNGNKHQKKPPHPKRCDL